MPRVLFWNVGKRPRDRLLGVLVAEHTPDLLVVIEPSPAAGLPRGIARTGYRRVGGSGRFLFVAHRDTVLARLPYPDATDRAEFWHLNPDRPDGWLLAVVHGPDRRNAPHDDTRTVLFRQIFTHLTQLENNFTNHRRTVLFGDLNANPFDASVMGASGLHAIGVRRVRGQFSRGIRNVGHQPFFYNPMWRLYGSNPDTDAAAATYFHGRGYDATEPFWHMLDQVLIRSEVADRLPPGELRILTTAGAERLVTTVGVPDPETASDHLPVIFALE